MSYRIPSLKEGHAFQTAWLDELADRSGDRLLRETLGQPDIGHRSAKFIDLPVD